VIKKHSSSTCLLTLLFGLLEVGREYVVLKVYRTPKVERIKLKSEHKSPKSYLDVARTLPNRVVGNASIISEVFIFVKIIDGFK